MEFGLLVLWLAVFLLLGGVTLPFAAWLLPETAHSAFAIPIALAVLTVVGHLVGHLAFGWPAVLAGLAVLGGLSLYGDRQTDTTLDPKRVGEHALVFTAGFLLVVLIRGFDPSAAPLPVAIGEKFLDFGLLATLDRTGQLPPESMWFAGEPVRYYYGGHLLTSLLATLTGTAPAYAYNLALAGFFGTLVTAAYGLAGSIALTRNLPRRGAGALGAFFVGIAGNLETMVRLVVWRLPDGPATTLVSTLGLEREMVEWTPRQFSYFDASRVVPVRPDDPDSFLAATEFPLFAWLNGDLHAHMMSQPFMLLAAALLLAAWRAPVTHRRRLLFVFLPPLAGLLGFLNLWSLPTVLGLTALGVAFDPADPRELLPERFGPGDDEHWLREEVFRPLLGVGVAVVVFLAGVLWTLPFWTTVVFTSGGEQSLAYWGHWTPLGPFVVVFGAFLVAITASVICRFPASVPTATEEPFVWRLFSLTGLLVVVGLAALFNVAIVGIAVVLLAAGWWLLRGTDPEFDLVLVVAGAGLVLLVEFVTIEGERFNVIFKPYVHVWLFWAIGAAVALTRLSWPETGRVKLRPVGVILAVVLVALTVPYAAIAVPDHVNDGTPTSDAAGPTLDGTAYLDVHYPQEADAIRWLDDRPGQQTIVTAAPARYWWDYERVEGASAPASLTGHPTVAGWSHERQYRGRAVYRDRVADVTAIYEGEPAEQRRLLAEYDVEYIYVGPVEGEKYAVSVDSLDAVSVAQSWENVTIYEVDQAALEETQ